jgi:DNA-directed RNA polymerase subunit RPC12/RpoP
MKIKVKYNCPACKKEFDEPELRNNSESKKWYRPASITNVCPLCKTQIHLKFASIKKIRFLTLLFWVMFSVKLWFGLPTEPIKLAYFSLQTFIILYVLFFIIKISRDPNAYEIS